MPPWAFMRYVQIISNDIAQAYPRQVPPLISHVCHRSGHDFFLCDHKSIVACTFQLRLVAQHSAPYNMAGQIAVL
jgi:hypothetical protein